MRDPRIDPTRPILLRAYQGGQEVAWRLFHAEKPAVVMARALEEQGATSVLVLDQGTGRTLYDGAIRRAVRRAVGAA